MYEQMNKITVVIIDDEPAARRALKLIFSEFEEFTVIGEASDGVSAVTTIRELNPDLVFLDIEMPEMNGLQVAESIKDLDCQIVFLTAFEKYALPAFNTNAIDYLVKPVRSERVAQCIGKLSRKNPVHEMIVNKGSSSKSVITLKEGSNQYVLDEDQIVYIEAIGRYRRLLLTPKGRETHNVDTIISDTTLDNFQKSLPEITFMRIHRSYLVNVNQVVGLFTQARQMHLKLADFPNNSLPVSRSQLPKVKERFKSL